MASHGSAPGILACAEFEAGFPDEEELAPGDVEIPLGRPIAEHLRARLEVERLAVSEVHRHSSYGWAFEVRFGSVTVWCMLQGYGVWLLYTEVTGRWIDRLLRRAPDEKHQVVVDVLRRVLSEPPFRDAKWRTAAQFKGSR